MTITTNIHTADSPAISLPFKRCSFALTWLATTAVGAKDGVCVGMLVGCVDGGCVGGSVLRIVGEIVEVPKVGDDVGNKIDGCTVGVTDGVQLVSFTDGTDVGSFNIPTIDGKLEGNSKVGTTDGLAVGSGGEPDGWLVGGNSCAVERVTMHSSDTIGRSHILNVGIFRLCLVTLL
jgi:hypothetical protein